MTTITAEDFTALDLIGMAEAISRHPEKIPAHHERIKAWLKRLDDGTNDSQHVIDVRNIERHLADFAAGKGHRERALLAIEHTVGSFIRRLG